MTRSTQPKQFVTVNDSRMAYREAGEGDPIVFIHGNPTSSYLWRDVIGEVAPLGRCLAPDLIGMGDSDKLPDSGPNRYTFAEHRRFLDSWIDAVDASEKVTLVGHDWGAALAFDWARRHPSRVCGIAYMEAPVATARWADFPEQAAQLFGALRSATGEAMILEQNMFIEQLLPAGVLTTLSEEAMAEYRRPFANRGEGRRPMLSWARQIPIDTQPADVAETITANGEWLASSTVPKLLVNAEPGQILVGPARELCRTWPNQTEITVTGRHFIQEDAGPEIGRAIAAWRKQLDG